MLWTVFSWETSGLGIHVTVTLTCTTYHLPKQCLMLWLNVVRREHLIIIIIFMFLTLHEMNKHQLCVCVLVRTLMADLALNENVEEVIVWLLALSAGYELAQHGISVVLVQH